jgi:hypothetical protein
MQVRADGQAPGRSSSSDHVWWARASWSAAPTASVWEVVYFERRPPYQSKGSTVRLDLELLLERVT